MMEVGVVRVWKAHGGFSRSISAHPNTSILSIVNAFIDVVVDMTYPPKVVAEQTTGLKDRV